MARLDVRRGFTHREERVGEDFDQLSVDFIVLGAGLRNRSRKQIEAAPHDQAKITTNHNHK